MRISVRLSTIVITAIALATSAGTATAQKPDQPVTLDNPSGDIQPLTGEDRHALTISGFGVGGYTYDGKTNDNSFAAGKVAVALFRELTDNLYVFGQLTTAISNGEMVASRSPRPRSTICS